MLSLYVALLTTFTNHESLEIDFETRVYKGRRWKNCLILLGGEKVGLRVKL